MNEALNERDYGDLIGKNKLETAKKYGNKQVEIWQNFCILHCKKFYNFMKPFYNLLKNDDFTNVYRKVYIENDQHFNEEGNKIIAENFLKLYKE